MINGKQPILYNKNATNLNRFNKTLTKTLTKTEFPVIPTINDLVETISFNIKTNNPEFPVITNPTKTNRFNQIRTIATAGGDNLYNFIRHEIPYTQAKGANMGANISYFGVKHSLQLSSKYIDDKIDNIYCGYSLYAIQTAILLFKHIPNLRLHIIYNISVCPINLDIHLISTTIYKFCKIVSELEKINITPPTLCFYDSNHNCKIIISDLIDIGNYTYNNLLEKHPYGYSYYNDYYYYLHNKTIVNCSINKSFFINAIKSNQIKPNSYFVVSSNCLKTLGTFRLNQNITHNIGEICFIPGIIYRFTFRNYFLNYISNNYVQTSLTDDKKCTIMSYIINIVDIDILKSINPHLTSRELYDIIVNIISYDTLDISNIHKYKTIINTIYNIYNSEYSLLKNIRSKIKKITFNKQCKIYALR